MTTVALVGMGLMGSVIDKHLLDAGFVVRGFDSDPQRRAQHAARGGISVASPAEAVDGVEFAVLSLPHGGIVREVCLGAGGVAETARSGLVVLDTSTAAPQDSIATAEQLAKLGITFLDATVSGTSIMAAAGDLIAMVGGNRDAYERAGPVLDAFTRGRYHLGDVGAGVRTKLVVNLVLGVNRAVLAEALVLGEQSGLDLPVLLEVLKDSAASSKAMDIWGTRMIEGQHWPPGGQIRIHAKDVGLILALGSAAGAPLWLATALDQLLRVAQMDGLAEADSSATMEVLRRMTGRSRFSMDDVDAGPAAATRPAGGE